MAKRISDIFWEARRCGIIAVPERWRENRQPDHPEILGVPAITDKPDQSGGQKMGSR
jgi:hypothetical protein